MSKLKHVLILVAIALVGILLYKKVSAISNAVNKIPGFA